MPRNRAMWWASYRIPEQNWRPALEMPGAEIAETTYRPSGWTHQPLRLVIRRRLLEVAELGGRRARRRRTVPRLQLQLALNGSVSQVYGYSFILTDLAGDALAIELWQRQRAHIEERIKDAKLGCGLIHLPLGTLPANRGWQAAAVIAVNLVAMLSAVLLDTLPAPAASVLPPGRSGRHPEPRRGSMGHHSSMARGEVTDRHTDRSLTSLPGAPTASSGPA